MVTIELVMVVTVIVIVAVIKRVKEEQKCH